MCIVISGYIGWNGKFYFGDFLSHSSAEEEHGLSASLKSKKPPVPFEWPNNDNGESINVRIPDVIERDQNFYKAIILASGGNRKSFLKYALEGIKKHSGSLDLRGCDLAGIKLPESIGGYLYLSGCDLAGIKLPETIGGSLDLSGCDLAGIKLPETIGGSLDLRGCDLAGIKLPETIGGSLYLRGCDLAGIKLPETLKNKMVQ